MVFKKLGKEKVPANLYPNNVNQAKEILAAAQQIFGIHLGNLLSN
jgi:hypothetical protein